MTITSTDQLQAGDVVEYGGNLHRIVRVERRAGWAWPVAIADEGWALALGRAPIAVHARAR